MDICESSENSELETMGNILSAVNENKTKNSEDEPLVNENIEVSTSQDDNIESSNLQNTNLDPIENTSSSDNLGQVISTQDIDEHEELWLEGNTRQLVKVDTDEDFEVIVKSLETAIVETERYDNDCLPFTLPSSLIEMDQNNSTQTQDPVNEEEFATISVPKVQPFDDQSSSLFETIVESQNDIQRDEPSLLELQETTMPQVISETENNDMIIMKSNSDHSDISEICESSCDEEQRSEDNSIFLRHIEIKKDEIKNIETQNPIEKEICVLQENKVDKLNEERENTDNGKNFLEVNVEICTEKDEADKQKESIDQKREVENDDNFETQRNNDNHNNLTENLLVERIKSNLIDDIKEEEDKEAKIIEIQKDECHEINVNQQIKDVETVKEFSELLDACDKFEETNNENDIVEEEFINKNEEYEDMKTLKQENNVEEELIAKQHTKNQDKIIIEEMLTDNNDCDEKEDLVKCNETIQEKIIENEELISQNTIIVPTKNENYELEKEKKENTDEQVEGDNAQKIVENVEKINVIDEKNYIINSETTINIQIQEEDKTELKQTSSSKQLLEENDEQSPPKKIKLIREKFQAASNIINEQENKKIEIEKQVTIEPICEKIDETDEKNANKMPMKPTQKLKLQRNYKLPEKIIERKIEKVEIEKNNDDKTEYLIKEKVKSIVDLIKQRTEEINNKEDLNTKECLNKIIDDTKITKESETKEEETQDKNDSSELNVEIYKDKDNNKSEKEVNNLLTIDAQFPLLASRLQEKFIPKERKEEPKVIPVVFPTISRKEECHDHSLSLDAVMKSATKIKISKRKFDDATKPLSVEVDDIEPESVPKIVIKPIPKPSSPKITIKPMKQQSSNELSPIATSSSSHSPKITIKPIVKPDTLKITITKQKTDDTHSILKIYQPDDRDHDNSDNPIIPKLTIKPIPMKTEETQHSPRITIKPIVKPISPKQSIEILHSPKMMHVNSPDSYPKVTIKPVLSPRQIKSIRSMTFESSSGVTVEPICVPGSDNQQNVSKVILTKPQFTKVDESLSQSKLTIKPITKTCEIVQSEDGSLNPLKLTIKPILKPEETAYQSPKITIKPVVKPPTTNDEIEHHQQFDQEMPEKQERIILKIQKTNLSSPKETNKKEPEIKIEAIPPPDQKLDKIKLKLTKEGSHAQIIPTETSSTIFSLKRTLTLSDTSNILEKRTKSDFPELLQHSSDISINIVEPNATKPTNQRTIGEEVTILKIDKTPMSEQQISQSKFKEMLMKIQQKPEMSVRASGLQSKHIIDDHENEFSSSSSSSDDVKIISVTENDPLKDPLSLQDESSSQDVMIVNEIINNPFKNVQIINAQTGNLQTTPKKRGRPRKNPIEVKPEIKGEDCVEIRPKRTCRGTPGRTPFAVKERKPRGSGRGRGSSRGRGSKTLQKNSPKEIKIGRGGGKALKEAKMLAKLEASRLAKEIVIDEITIEDSTNDTTPAATPIPPPIEIDCPPKRPDVKEKMTEEILKEPHPPAPVVYEEETRMSAENTNNNNNINNRAQVVPLTEGPEESQSSVQSTATTESTKTKKGRLEVCDPDSAVTSVDQIVEYSWANGGPYMLQEQIAQYLGVKSFKRKYPGLTRRPVEMQERDYIREKGLVSESMCDMGLTAVPSSEILDIMYSDFQDKYEEYRKCLRDKQAKEISNKQKAVSLATSQEKNKLDFKERAIRSAANWNCNFNKARKESRKCFMDLQTFTINYPAGKIKVPHKNPVGHYPIALVPGQFTDYFKSYSSNELNYLPLNTVRFGPVLPNQRCEINQSDGSQSDSDSSSGTDSDSSDESMSTEEESTATTSVICKSGSVQLSTLSTPKSKLH